MEDHNHLRGHLYVVVPGARGVGKIPAYFHICLFDDEIGKSKRQKLYKSKTTKGDSEPSWNDGSKLFDVHQEHKSLMVALKAEKKLMNASIGSVSLDLEEIMDGVPVNRWFPLEGKKGKKESGELHLQLMFLRGDEKVEGDEFTSPLQSLLRRRRVEAARALLTKEGAKYVNLKDSSGFYPLHLAAQYNLPDMVSLLIKHGASINKKGGKLGITALHAACVSSPESVSILLDHKAKTTVADKEGNLPLHVATKNDQPKSIALLLDAGASVESPNGDGNTPLHLAVQSKAFLAIRALIEKNANIYAKNKQGVTCGEAAAKLDEHSKEIFMKTVGVEDYQEIALLQDWTNRLRVETSRVSFEWQNSPQIAISATKPTPVRILVHHQGAIDNSNIGYVVIKSVRGVHKEPSLSELLGHGSNTTPFEIMVDPSFHTVVVPYAKTKDQPDRVSVLVFTKEGDEVQIKKLQPWKHCQSLQGEWKGASAGGCQNEKKTWHQNPFFSLIIPKKENVELSIVLAQKKSAIEEILPYQTIPYDLYIGYYLYDGDVEKIIGQVPKWKNAAEVLCDWTLNGKETRQYTIIPTTYKAKEETTFTITVYSDEEKVFLKNFQE